uniref:Uncharacterized protein n=1 Tax=Anguilla anguilla TaxID=7936 RepID=A0A0E9T7W7_ANGAN
MIYVRSYEQYLRSDIAQCVCMQFVFKIQRPYRPSSSASTI